jgi:hypothetical protein
MFVGSTFQVVPVTHKAAFPSAKKWTSDETEWRQLRDGIYKCHKLEVIDSIKARKAETIVIGRLLAGTADRKVHCEYVLISFLHRQRTTTLAVSYIGVSKLSCKPCHLWISAYNKHAGAGHYYTKGTHDKWYAGWKRPSLDDDTAQERVDDALIKRWGSFVRSRLMQTTLGLDLQIARIRANVTYLTFWMMGEASLRLRGRWLL